MSNWGSCQIDSCPCKTAFLMSEVSDHVRISLTQTSIPNLYRWVTYTRLSGPLKGTTEFGRESPSRIDQHKEDKEDKARRNKRKAITKPVNEYRRYGEMIEELGGGYRILLHSMDAEHDFIKLLEDLKMNRVEAKLLKVYIDGILHSLANDGITLLKVCGTKIMVHRKRKITLRKIRKLTRQEDANDLENSKKSVEVEKEDKAKGTFSTSMKKEDHEKSMKFAEVDKFKEKEISTSMNKEDHGNIKSVEIGKEENVKEKGTSSTSMNKEDCETNRKSVEVGKKDTIDEKEISSTNVNKEDQNEHRTSKDVTKIHQMTGNKATVRGMKNQDPDEHSTLKYLTVLTKMTGNQTTVLGMKNQEEESLEHQRKCKICLDVDLCMVFFPCRHLVACEACSDRLTNCAVCRALIRGSIKVNFM